MSGLNNDGNKAPEKVWVRKFIEAFSEGVANQLALGLLALMGVALSWLWGWYAAGGVSNILGYIPANAVVAFDLKTKCPTGWGDFKGAWGGRYCGGA
ncbi:hypothetical protein [Rhizobium rhizosphaerae]|uniref:hypothetical protein n=1 Tax=Xaviernesmea rhizosphaerae TaxID=1672749 RepID=UPI00117B0BE1|nr:hypothetical protein [Xaviernesmea rhizosphaerae]